MAYDPIKIKGTVMWACFHKKNALKDTKNTCDISHLNEEDIKKLTDAGLGKFVRHDDKNKGDERLYKGNFISVGSLYPPKVKVDGKLLEGEEKDTVGNGSKALFRITPYDTKKFGGPFAGFDYVKVTDLVKFEASDDDPFDDDDDDMIDDPLPDNFDD